MPVKVIIKKGTRKIKNDRKIKGDSLKEAKGFLNTNFSEWGQFHGKVSIVKTKKDKAKKIIEVSIRQKLKTSLPKWLGKNKAPKKCQDEWDRMTDALKKHEEVHFALFKEQLVKYIRDLEQTTSLDEVKLTKMHRAFEKKVADAFKELDNRTEKGRKQGVDLKIEFECQGKSAHTEV